jgi:beta-galactosidase
VRADRAWLGADGEDVAVFAVEVHDAKGRLVPITDNVVTFAVKGPGRLLGVGNGDPTSHESDLGPSRRAFGGLCAAIVQASKSAGRIEVEATSPGLQPSTASIESRAVAFRPQVAAWERAVPDGPGVTGLWRPETAEASGAKDPLLAAALGGEHDLVFSLRQDGGTLTGELDEVGDGFFNFDAGGPIEDGRVDASSISFRVGSKKYSGTATAERLDLTVTASLPFGGGSGRGPQAPPPSARPAVGPPPDDVDPSIPMEMLAPLFAPKTIVLRRVRR